MKLKDCDSSLEKLGAERTTPVQQQVHLDRVSQQFQQILGQAVTGLYSDRHFFKPSVTSHDPRRLRASLQALNDQFAKRMFEKGHRRYFEVGSHDIPALLPSAYSHSGPDDELNLDNPERITRTGYLSRVRNLMSRNRGTELPDAVDHRLVRELFCEQSEKWFRTAEEHLELASDLVEDTLKEIIQYTADDLTANKILVHWIEPKMDKREKKLVAQAPTGMFLAPFQDRGRCPPSFPH